jgi:hypothetical protein
VTGSAELIEQQRAILDSLSHELRTPLTVLRCFTDTLAHLGVLPADYVPLLEAQRRAVGRLEELLDQVLAQADLTKQHPARRNADTIIDVGQLYYDILEDIRPVPSPGRTRFLNPHEVRHIRGVRPVLRVALRGLLEQQLRVLASDQVLFVIPHRLPRHVRFTIGPDPGDPSDIRVPEAAPQGSVGVRFVVAQELIRRVAGEIAVHAPGTQSQTVALTLPQGRAIDPRR